MSINGFTLLYSELNSLTNLSSICFGSIFPYIYVCPFSNLIVGLLGGEGYLVSGLTNLSFSYFNKLLLYF